MSTPWGLHRLAAHSRTGQNVQLHRREVLERLNDGVDEVDVALQQVQHNVKDGDREAVAELAQVAAGLLDIFGRQPTAGGAPCRAAPRARTLAI